MTMTGAGLSADKTDLYRIGVGQPLLPADQAAGAQVIGQGVQEAQQADTPANYCANLVNVQTAFIAANQARFAQVASPVPLTGSNLLTFMAARLSASFANLGCAGFNLKNTVSLTTANLGVAVAATFNLVQQAPQVVAAAAAAPATDPATPAPDPSQPSFPAGSVPTTAPSAGASQPWTPSAPWGQGQTGGSGYGYGN